VVVVVVVVGESSPGMVSVDTMAAGVRVLFPAPGNRLEGVMEEEEDHGRWSGWSGL